MAQNPNYKQAKYIFALQNIVFYAVHCEGCVLSYYKDGPIELDDNAPAVLQYLSTEYDKDDFHDRYWTLRAWVSDELRKDPNCGIKFTEQTYDQLFQDLEGIDPEVDQLLQQTKDDQGHTK